MDKNKKRTFTNMMRENGFNPREIRYYRQKLYRSGYKIADVCDIRLQDGKYVNIYFDLWNDYVMYRLIHK